MELEFYLYTPPWEWPPESGKVFLKILTDSNARLPDRVIAAELSGDSVVIDETLTDALLTIIGSPNEPDKLRATAAISLGPVLELADTSDFDDDFVDEVPITKPTFEKMRETLEKLYLDESIPKLVRRRILEGSVRAPQDWHKNAIAKAYATGDHDWILSAVFAMEHVRGFDKEILESLKAGDQDILRHAIRAAGNWEVTEAWPAVKPLLKASKTPKPLLLAAIEAANGLCPEEAAEILHQLADSNDEEIREAAEEALLMSAPSDDDDFDDEEDEPPQWVN